MPLNINPDDDDPNNQYKMPKLVKKIEGKGNGIKTVITNITDIAEAIYRKPSYPIKYFGMELGTQTISGGMNNRYIVKGYHDAAKLQEVLYTFIKKFVLCSRCGNPETFLTIKKKVGTVVAKCKACEPMIYWLKTADYESSDDEENEKMLKCKMHLPGFFWNKVSRKGI